MLTFTPVNRNILIWMICGFTLLHCANPIPPDGGPKDRVGPQLREDASTPNYQTNFNPKEIFLLFDEWINLNKPQSQILISPPLQYNPKIRGRGKEVVITFDDKEELRTNTTYSIQFGEGIQDITESNPADELRFVFSTGDNIDSLSLTGKVLSIDQTTPVEGSMVMLYTEINDSLPFLEKPAYTGKTDENGLFRIENLRADTFKVFVLQDENRNYLFDPKSEAMGFLSSPVILSDTFSPNISLTQFKPIPPFRITDSRVKRNKATIKWEGSLTPEMLLIPDAQVELEEWFDDSLNLWLDTPQDSFILIRSFEGQLDTISLKKGRKYVRDTTRINLNRSAMKSAPKASEDTLFLFFNQPVSSFDTSKISVLDTGSTNLNVRWFKNRTRTLSGTSLWPSEQEVRVILSPDAVIGITDSANTDSLKYGFFIPNKEKLGAVIISCTKTQTTLEDHVVYLTRNDQVIKRMTFNEQNLETAVVVPNLPPGKYKVEIIVDRNGNGKWDTGNYLKGIQPEKKWTQELEALRENWDLKVTLEL